MRPYVPDGRASSLLQFSPVSPIAALDACGVARTAARRHFHTMMFCVRAIVGLLAFAGAAASLAAPTLNVGSKRFTESYILGEILKQTAQSAGEASVTHRQGLGNTAIVLGALTSGSIDIYTEYTGTIAKEILKLDSVPPLAELSAKLE